MHLSAQLLKLLWHQNMSPVRTRQRRKPEGSIHNSHSICLKAKASPLPRGQPRKQIPSHLVLLTSEPRSAFCYDTVQVSVALSDYQLGGQRQLKSVLSQRRPEV